MSRTRAGLVALALAGIALEAGGFSLLPPMLPQLVAELRLSSTDAGVLTGLYAFGTILGGLGGIRVVARAGGRAASLSGFVALSVPLPLLGLSAPLLLLDAARLTQGIGAGLLWSGALAWLNLLFGPSGRGRALGLATAAAVTGNLIGPLLGTLAVQTHRTAVCVALAVVVALLGAATVIAQRRFKRTTRVAAPPDPAAPRPTWTGFATTAAATLVPGSMLGGLVVLLPLRMSELGGGSATIAVTLSSASVLAAVCAALTGRLVDRRDPHVCTVIVLVVAGAALAVAGFAASVPQLAIAGTVIMLLSTIGFVAAGALLQAEARRGGVPDHVVGPAVNTTFALGEFVGGPLAGVLLRSAGPAVATGVLAAGAGLAAAVLVTGRDRDGQPASGGRRSAQPKADSSCPASENSTSSRP